MKNEILKRVAPCSLICHTCSAYNEGVICKSSKNLLKSLSGMKEFCEKHIPQDVEDYTKFEEVLMKYSSGPCSGCRDTKNPVCSIKGCFIFDCTKEHQVDFCGECNDFPCTKVTGLFEDVVYEQWLTGNTQIKALGIETFWKNNCKKPHLKAYKK